MATYGEAIQMKSAIETNGNLCRGNLEDGIFTHQNTFLNAKCAKFTLSQDHYHNLNYNLTQEATNENTSIDPKLVPPIKLNQATMFLEMFEIC